MIDAHCHLNFPQFDNDLEDVLKRAKDNKVNTIINVGTSIESSGKVIKLTENYKGLFATVGIHPHETEKLTNDWESEFEKLASHPKVVAIGETGLDYFRENINKNGQKKLFTKQIELSIKLKLPLQIHNRQAGDDILDILTAYKNEFNNPPGLFHCFSGNFELLKKVLNLGFYIGYDGNITYKGIAKGETTALTELVKQTPIDRIITETDAPFLSPIPYRGNRNEPSYVIIITKEIAEIKNISKKEVIEKTVQNAKNLFKYLKND